MKPPAAVPPTVPDDPGGERPRDEPPRAATTVDGDAPPLAGAAPNTPTTQPDEGDAATEDAALRLLEATRGAARPLRLLGELVRAAVALAITVVAWQGLLRVSNTGAAQSEPTRTLLPALLAFVVTRMIFRLGSRRFVRPLRGLS